MPRCDIEPPVTTKTPAIASVRSIDFFDQLLRRSRELAGALGQLLHRHRLVAAADVDGSWFPRFEHEPDRAGHVPHPAPAARVPAVDGDRLPLFRLPEEARQRAAPAAGLDARSIGVREAQ